VNEDVMLARPPPAALVTAVPLDEVWLVPLLPVPGTPGTGLQPPHPVLSVGFGPKLNGPPYVASKL
jgi:hypothetical protein